ncbi:MAG: hypothetical protein GXP62_02715 [Oligoflexia bacterium]|nr:hypothetical protein [Oligoflexia bacterium]
MPRLPLIAFLLSSSLTACAPLYRAAPPQVLLFEKAGDFNAAGHVSTDGIDVNAGYAVNDHLAARGGAQVAGLLDDGSYQRVSTGLGYFATHGHLRAAALFDLGGGYARGSNTVTGTDFSSTTTYQGAFALFSGHFELGAEYPNLGLALVLRPTDQLFWHDSASDGTGTGTLFMGEAFASVRVGSPTVKVEASAGLVMPLIGRGDMGIPPPVVLGLGLVLDPILNHSSQP